MLSEAIDRIYALAEEANQVEFYEDKLPRKVLVRHRDQLIEKEIPPPDRLHAFSGFEDVVAFAKLCPKPHIFHDTEVVWLITDADDRRERVTMPLHRTQRFKTLEQLQQPRQYSVKDAVKLLRYNLHDGTAASVVAALSRIDFTRKSDGGAAVDHGKESLGRRVEAHVQQADQVPEVFEVTVPLYSTPGLKSFRPNVRVGVYLDLEDEAIELRVLADEISSAVDEVQAGIHKAFVEALPDVPVFHGQPGP